MKNWEYIEIELPCVNVYKFVYLTQLCTCTYLYLFKLELNEKKLIDTKLFAIQTKMYFLGQIFLCEYPYFSCLKKFKGKYQPSGEGGTLSPPAMPHRTACNAAPPAKPHRLQNPKWPPAGPKRATGVWAF